MARALDSNLFAGFNAFFGTLWSEARSLGAYLRRYRDEFAVIAVTASVILIGESLQLWDSPLKALGVYGLAPLCCGLALGMRPRDLGLGLGSVRVWLPPTCGLLVLGLPLLLIAAQLSEVSTFYGARSFDPLGSLVGITLYMIGWEFLLRGFLLFGLKKSLGELTILVQILPFAISHLNKPQVEALSCIVSGLVWGYICYRGNSFWPAVILHVAVNYTNQALTSWGSIG